GLGRRCRPVVRRGRAEARPHHRRGTHRASRRPEGVRAVSLPFYVSPEQQMVDRAEFARKGIARGRAVVVLRYAGGIAMVAENHSTTLNKVAEIYDRIGFAAVGRYNEFET